MKLNLVPFGPNQTQIVIGEKVIFFSYSTPVAARIGKNFYYTSKKWSATTSRHISKWLDGANAEEKDQSFFDSLA